MPPYGFTAWLEAWEYVVATIAEALALAVQYHQQGAWQQAEQIYRQILQVDPNHADALHLLGVLAYQAGQYELAVEYMGRAIRSERRPGALSQ